MVVCRQQLPAWQRTHARRSFLLEFGFDADARVDAFILFAQNVSSKSPGKARRYQVGGHADRSVESKDPELHSSYARGPYCAVEIDLCGDTLVLRADQIRFVRCGPYGWRHQPAKHQIRPLDQRQFAAQSGPMVRRRYASSRVVVAGLERMDNAI